MTQAATKSTSKPAPKPAPKKWEMPKPELGQPVLVQHRTSIRDILVGFVVEVGTNSISCVAAGQYYADVWHKDDPRLKSNPQLKMEIDGTWEHTQGTKNTERRLAALEKQVFKSQ